MVDLDNIVNIIYIIYYIILKMCVHFVFENILALLVL